MKLHATARAHAPAGGAAHGSGHSPATPDDPARLRIVRATRPSLATVAYRPPPTESGFAPARRPAGSAAGRGQGASAPGAARGAGGAGARHDLGRRPEWCVDDRGHILSMTLFELWSAVASGAVGPRARAWRLGMECWTPVAQIEELALAALQAPAPSERDGNDGDEVEELGDVDLVELLPDEISGSVAAALSAFPELEAREGDEGDEGARHALTPPAPPGALASPAAPGLSGRPILEAAPPQAEALVVAAAVWRLERGKLWIGLGALAASVALVLAPTLAGRGPSARALESGAEPASVAEPAPAPSPPSISPDTLGRVDAPPPMPGPADVIPVAALPDAPGLRALPPPLPPPPEASAPRAEAGQRRLRARSAPAGGLARGARL